MWGDGKMSKEARAREKAEAAADEEAAAKERAETRAENRAEEAAFERKSEREAVLALSFNDLPTEAPKDIDVGESITTEPEPVTVEPDSVTVPAETFADDRSAAVAMKEAIDNGKILFSDVPMTHPYWSWRDRL